MLVRPGKWLGKGSLLFPGISLGTPLTCDLDIELNHDGFLLDGELVVAEEPSKVVNVRIVPNEEGTYVVDAHIAGIALDGQAKMDSEPNLGLLWNERVHESATCTLFAVRQGFGCRGFFRNSEGQTLTWEIAFGLKQTQVGGGNVVSLHRRR